MTRDGGGGGNAVNHIRQDNHTGAVKYVDSIEFVYFNYPKKSRFHLDESRRQISLRARRSLIRSYILDNPQSDVRLIGLITATTGFSSENGKKYYALYKKLPPIFLKGRIFNLNPTSLSLILNHMAPQVHA